MANMRKLTSDTMIDPLTGKLVPRPPPKKLDLVTPVVTPPEVTQSEYNTCLARLKELRTQFADLQPGQRSGKTGDKMMREYRHESLKLMHLAGEKAPPIYGDM